MNINDELKPGQSIELLKELHILTRDGKMNQDSRRKLKQVYHLFNFIEPMFKKSLLRKETLNLVDHGAGKSYLGFILYDLFLKNIPHASVFGIENREELVLKSKELAKKLSFERMDFKHLTVQDSLSSNELPDEIDFVTALHACDTATDDAIKFALKKKAHFIFLVPCCQAEVATHLRKIKQPNLSKNVLTEIYRHSLHTREFGSHLTNVLRCLELEAHGYQVTVTELVGFEHSMKNEIIIAEFKNLPQKYSQERLNSLIEKFNLEDLRFRFMDEKSYET
jgi:hypothetical protein